MKRMLALLLAAMLCFALFACGTESAPETDPETETQEQPQAEPGNATASQPTRKEQVEAAIVGEWTIESDRIDFDLFIHEDHTGRAVQHETMEEKTIAWSYDTDADRILLYVQDKAYVYYMIYSDTDGVETLSYSGENFTRK